MKFITSEEMKYLAEKERRLHEQGVVVKVPKTKKLTTRQAVLLYESVMIAEKHRDEMRRLGLPINEELQLEFLSALGKAAGAAAKGVGGAVAKGAKIAGSAAMTGAKELGKGAAKGAAELGKGAVKGAQAAAKDFMSSVKDSPQAQKSLESAATSQNTAATSAKKALDDVSKVVKTLPSKQQATAQRAGKTAIDQLKKSMQSLYDKLNTEMGDPDLAKMMMSSAMMKLVVDISAGGAKK